MTTTATPPARPAQPAPPPGERRRASLAARTLRTDRWWFQPLITVIALACWLIYAVVRAATQKNYWVPQYHYLTPFASPCLSQSCVPEAAVFGRPLPHFPPLVPFAIVTLAFLLCFRLTCYYYRKAYYRSFWQSPPACAVREPHKRYSGETRFPLIIQNFHRYFFYVALLISLINTWDAIDAFHGRNGGVGMGLGTLIMVANVVALWLYSLSCHSCRNLTAGRLNHFSKHPVRYKLWGYVTKLNGHHMLFAWITLGSLVLTDAYIGLVASGTITDLRFFN
jgi:hypothetical protein